SRPAGHLRRGSLASGRPCRPGAPPFPADTFRGGRAPMRARPATVRGRPAPLLREQRVWGWVFLSPWLIGFLAFTILPILASLVFSFTDFRLTTPDEVAFVGLDNYRKLFVDPLVKVSLGVTLKFALISLPLAVLLPVALASLLDSKWLAG